MDVVDGSTACWQYGQNILDSALYYFCELDEFVFTRRSAPPEVRP